MKKKWMYAAGAAALGLLLAVGWVFRIRAPRNTTDITVFDQGLYRAQSDTDSWALPGYDDVTGEHRSLATAGCHLFSYAHALQWLTETSRGEDVLSELLRVCKNPSDQNENSHAIACAGLHGEELYSRDVYTAYLREAYGIELVELEKDFDALYDHFSAGGVVVSYLPGHYVLAVEGKSFSGKPYVHIIDSNWGTAKKKGFTQYFETPFGTLSPVRNTSQKTYTCGSDYWVSYQQYRKWAWKTALLPAPGGSR